MHNCLVCQSSNMEELLDFGPQPVCNRFLKDPDADEAIFPLGFSHCLDCGLLQLTELTDAAEHLPPYEWISYNEAEGHLDNMVDELLKICPQQPDARILGVCYKDASTLERLGRKGVTDSHVLDPQADLGIESPLAGTETIQAALTPSRAQELAERLGRFDVVIARHILEHAHDIQAFSEALRTLLKPDGCLVVEIPDYALALKGFDYSTVWEEHSVYFTPETFRNSFPALGFEPVHDLSYPYPLENSLVVFAHPQDNPAPKPPTPEVLVQSLADNRQYAQQFPARQAAIQKYLMEQQQQDKRVALFGAGHLACKFINILGVADCVDFVVDDHPGKKGLFMPGSRLPIVGSDQLIEQNIAVCLMSLNPESEQKVMARNQAFLDNGGTFYSIFPASKRALPISPTV